MLFYCTTAAVHYYYEFCRRLFNDSRASGEDTVAVNQYGLPLWTGREGCRHVAFWQFLRMHLSFLTHCSCTTEELRVLKSNTREGHGTWFHQTTCQKWRVKCMGSKRFVVHSPGMFSKWLLTSPCTCDDLWCWLCIYTVLNQLMKLDRRLQKCAHVTNEYQAVVRVDGPPLGDCLPRKLVHWHYPLVLFAPLCESSL